MLFGTVGGGISEYISKSVSPSCIQLRILYLYFLLPETKNITLCVFSFLCGFRTHFDIHLHSEEMDRLFAPGLKPWKAYKVVMADVRATHDSDVYAHSTSIDLEEKGVGSVEHHEKASTNDV